MTIDDSIKAKALIKLAEAALIKSDKDEAIGFILSALKLDPNLPEILICIAELDLSDQAMLLEKAALINSKSVNLPEALIWFERLRGIQQRTGVSKHPGNAAEVPPTRRIIHVTDNTILSGGQTRQKSAFKRFFSRWQTVVSIVIISFFIIISIAAPVLAPQLDPENPSAIKRSCSDRIRCPTQPPSENLPLGSVAEYDVYYSLIWGARQAVSFGLSSAFITAVIGSLLGLSAGYAGGKISTGIMRITDAFLCFPHIAAVALFANINMFYTNPYYVAMLEGLEPKTRTISTLLQWFIDADPVFLALVFFSWMPYTRILRVQTQSVKKQEYVEAARVVGAKPIRIVLRHILPNASPPAIVLFAKDIGRMVVLQTTFSFLGLGNDAAWGILLARATKWIVGVGSGMFRYWWVYLPMTAALILFGIAWNLLGDELNRWLNPRESRKVF